MDRRDVIAGLALSILVSGWGCGSARPIPLPPPPAVGERVPLPEDLRRQFDFWLGEWDVANKHARRGKWVDTGSATARIQSVAGGAAVLEQWNGALDGDPLIGFSLRAYDETQDQWPVRLNWHGGKPGGFSPMLGRRNGERMELFPPGDDQHMRYSFAEARTGSCQWEQGTSKDGETWITDWVMHFTKRAESLALDATNAPIVAPPESAAKFPQTRALDFLLGAWEGSHTAVGADGVKQKNVVRARVTSMIEGFGLLQFVDAPGGEKQVAALGWDERADGWVALQATHRGGGITRMTGNPDGRSVQFTAREAGLRESWSCPDEDACTWRSETSEDDGANWVISIEVEFTRSASAAAWIDIKNARAPSDRLLTGGQPTADQLAWAARNGYRTVVNLRAPDEKGELVGEAALVKKLGMEYVVIPMSSGDDLNAGNASKLAAALSGSDALPAMVHCASGNRVGALFGLKAHLEDGLSVEESLAVAHDAGITRMEPTLRQRLGLPSK